MVACLGLGTASASASALSFTGGPLPAPPVAPVNDLEPGIAADGIGTFIIGATAPSRGADLWTSHDGGLTYRYAADPFQAAPGEQGNPENGQDTDVAAAPLANGSGPPNLYATSLYVANSALVVSHDGGGTYVLNPLGGTPSQDRPWLAADGACTVYLAYQNGDSGPPSREMVSRFDACQAPAQTGRGAVLNPVQSPTDPYPLGSFLSGKPMVDNSPGSPFQHRLYLPMGGCESNPPSALFIPSTDPFDCQFANASLSIAVSSDGGQSFSVHRVTDSTTHELQVWPDQLAVDSAGEIYLAWSDNHHVYLNTSTDGGSTWSPSRVVSAPPALSAVLPTVAAGAPGHVDLAWYGAERDGLSNDPGVMGAPGGAGAAPWHVYFAKSVDAGRSFDQAVATGPLHTGIVCTSANACTTTHSRDLFDDFGIAISPTTQRASIAYTIDEATIDPHSLSTVLAGYATELPPGAAPGRLAATGCAAATRSHHARVRRGRTTTLQVTLTEGGRHVRGAIVSLRGPGFARRARTTSRGRVSFSVRPRRDGRATVSTSFCGGKLRLTTATRRRPAARFTG